MLPKIILRITSTILIFCFIVFDFSLPFKRIKVFDYSFVIHSIMDAYAYDFDEALQEGNTISNNSRSNFSPENLDQTLQQSGLGTADSITPKIDEANNQKGSYDNYYSNPGDLSSAPKDTEVGEYVTDSYSGRTKIDLSNDAVFGNNCLETDIQGKCIRWSVSADVISNTYEDCEKVVIAQYDDPPTEEICIGNNAIHTTECTTRVFANILTETVNSPCNEITIDYQPGQVYAVCRDYYDYYKHYYDQSRSKDDCSCDNHGGALCRPPTNYQVVSSRPSGSRVLGMSYENFRDRDRRRGWDYCTSDRYWWYTKYRESVIERVFLQYDSPCGSENIETWAKECSVNRLEQCDPSGSNCIVSIEDGQDTGDMPSFNYHTKVSQGQSTVSNCTGCTPVRDWEGSLIDYDCPSFQCTSGSCPSGAVTEPAAAMSAVKIGEGKALLSYECMSPPPPIERRFETFYYYEDPLVCNSFSGSIENYQICLKYYTISFNNGRGARTLTQTPVIEQDSTGEFGNTFYWVRIFGGPDVKPYLNNWYSRVTFSCVDNSNDCQALIDAGCVLYEQKCNDTNCDEIEYTYKCGGTGEVTGYEVTYNCAGDIRCLGTDCKDASYDANTDFAGAAAAMEVMNQYRVDADAFEIFPGEEQTCQSNPENCCKAPDGGMSVGDYVRAGKMAVDAYSYLYGGGTAATWANYSNAFSYVASSGQTGSLSGLVGLGSSSGYVSTTVSTQTLGLVGQDALSNAGMQVTFQAGDTAVISSAGSTVSSLATVATVVGIAYTVYAIGQMVYDFIYQCEAEDIITSSKLGMRVCHEVGEDCVSEALGVCLKKEKVYCCFNSLLARVLHEQSREQIGKGWGDAETPNCSGFTPGELGQIDFSKVDLREYMQYIQYENDLSSDKIQEIINRTQKEVQN